jgi:Domain of unknown function (DUF1707)
VTHAGLRASDDDRRRVVSELERHTADGRLTLDEFSERVGRVYGAATHADLASITHDLPAAPPRIPVVADPRPLLLAFVIAAVTIAVLGMVFAILK